MLFYHHLSIHHLLVTLSFIMTPTLTEIDVVYHLSPRTPLINLRYLIILVHLVFIFFRTTSAYIFFHSLQPSPFLSGFPKLKSLAVYGNPVEEHKHYRNFVLFTCKALKNFDMSPGE